MPLSYKQRLAISVVWAANSLGFLDAYSFLRRKVTRSQVAILMYHRVCPQKDSWSLEPLSPQDFERQLQYFCRNYEVLPLEELVQYMREGKSLPQKAVVITFDDGYRDNYLNAYPILKKYHVPAIIFLTTGHIGTGNLFWWDKIGYVVQNTCLEAMELGELGTYSLRSNRDRLQAASRIRARLRELPDEKKTLLIEKLVNISRVVIPANLGKEIILSWDEVREMNNDGIAFGAHTVTHPILTKLSLEKAKDEIIQSKKAIEKKLAQTVTAFSYPRGDFNDDIKEILKERGFVCAVATSPPRLVALGIDLYDLGRISPGWNLNTFKLSLSGLYPDLKTIRQC